MPRTLRTLALVSLLESTTGSDRETLCKLLPLELQEICGLPVECLGYWIIRENHPSLLPLIPREYLISGVCMAIAWRRDILADILMERVVVCGLRGTKRPRQPHQDLRIMKDRRSLKKYVPPGHILQKLVTRTPSGADMERVTRYAAMLDLTPDIDILLGYARCGDVVSFREFLRKSGVSVTGLFRDHGLSLMRKAVRSGSSHMVQVVHRLAYRTLHDFESSGKVSVATVEAIIATGHHKFLRLFRDERSHFGSVSPRALTKGVLRGHTKTIDLFLRTVRDTVSPDPIFYDSVSWDTIILQTAIHTRDCHLIAHWWNEV